MGRLIWLGICEVLRSGLLVVLGAWTKLLISLLIRVAGSDLSVASLSGVPEYWLSVLIERPSARAVYLHWSSMLGCWACRTRSIRRRCSLYSRVTWSRGYRMLLCLMSLRAVIS